MDIKVCKCGNVTMPGKTRCMSCTNKVVATNRKRYERNTSKGLCSCGRSIPVQGKTKCQSCLDSTKNARRKFAYGITTEHYTTLLQSQSNRCAICNIEFSNDSKNTKPHIDHDHKENKVRGLLCGYCNQSLGGFKEDTTILLNAISYLNHYSVVTEETITYG